MKIFPMSLSLTLLIVVCPDTFSQQKCKEGLPKGNVVFTNMRRPKITRKPQPQYTAEARSHQILVESL